MSDLDDVLAQVEAATQDLYHAQEAKTVAVIVAREAGATWQQIGDAIGVTRQAAQQKYEPEVAEAQAERLR